MKLTKQGRENLFGYLFIGIWIIGFLWLTAYPFLMSFVYSLNKVTITGSEGIRLEAVGFKNYLNIITTDFDFINNLKGFLLDVVVFLPTILIVSIIIALMLNQKLKLKGFFRSIFFFPVIISSGPIINELLKQGASITPEFSGGVFSNAFFEASPLLSSAFFHLFSQMVIVLWFSGVQIVLFLAALQKLDKEIYEAAEIDGANIWESFWKITLPTLKPMMLVASVYTIVFLATFSNNKIIVQIQRVMFDTQKGYGYSSALAWLYFIVVSLILLIAFLLFKPKRERRKR